MAHFAWESHGLRRPILVGMVRHPLDRVVSWYQYIRWHDRPDEKMPSKCNSTQLWKDFCRSMLEYRDNEKETHDQKIDFDTCYRCAFLAKAPADFLMYSEFFLLLGRA